MKLIPILVGLTTLFNVINGLGQLTLNGPPQALRLPSAIKSIGKTINFTVANFGDIPWGKSITAPLAISRYSNETHNDIHDACQPIPAFSRKDYNGHLPIVLVERGNCKFTEKARNVQQAGGRVALIYDNVYEWSEYITMGDDGSGDSVTVPSIFIREEYGEDLFKLEKKLEGEQNLMLTISFPIQQRERVDVGFYINLPNEAAQFFLEDFREIYPKMDQRVVDFYPVYQFMRGTKDEFGNFDRSNKNCIGAGRYCCYDPDGPGTATGREIAIEQVRGLCMYHYEKESEIWLDYNFFMKEKESNVQSYTKYSKEVVQILKQKYSSFDEARFNKCVSDNTANEESILLERQMNLTDSSGVWNWPAVHINNITYHGRYQAKAVEEAICAGTVPEKRNQRCQMILDPLNPNYYNQEGSSSGGASTMGVVGIILGVLFVIFALIIVAYKKFVRREMKGEMKTQVNEMVSNYIKFYEAKQKDTEN